MNSSDNHTLCATAASTAGLSGTWKAVIGDGSTAANAHITISGPVYLTNGLAVASNSAGFWSTSITNAPQVTEYGSANSSGNPYVWTGATNSGGISANNYCSNWSTTTGNGMMGSWGSTNAMWNSYAGEPCSYTYSLYCISQ